MSIKVMNLVWESAPYRGNTLLTLLALADWSDDEGYSYPSLQKLAQKSRQSVRSVQYSLDQLESDNIVRSELNQGRGSQNAFYINTKKLRVLQEEKTCKTEQENTQFSTRKGAKHDSVIRKNRQEPLRTVSEDSSCVRCGGKGTWSHKGHPGLQVYCWCPVGIALQRQEAAKWATA